MNEKLDFPSEFGGSWSIFSETWCRNAVLAQDPDQVTCALRTLCRLWPEKINSVIEKNTRGAGIIAPIVEHGILLNSCESNNSFHEVFQRLRGGERSAYAELVLVAMLNKFGYSVKFAPPVDGHVLDASCQVDNVEIYFEVVAPEKSDASETEQSMIDQLTQVIKNSVTECRVEIEVTSPISDEDIVSILEIVRSAPPSTWVFVDGKARLRRTDVDQTLFPIFDGEGAQITIGGNKVIQDRSTSVITRSETSDARAKRIFNEEYHQFSANVSNVLVVNVSAVSDGMKTWPSLMARLLQPSRNRKVGAVVFFEQGILGPPEAVRRRWCVLVNPHAHFSIPEALLTNIESLDESSIYGLGPIKRLIAD